MGISTTYIDFLGQPLSKKEVEISPDYFEITLKDEVVFKTIRFEKKIPTEIIIDISSSSDILTFISDYPNATFRLPKVTNMTYEFAEIFTYRNSQLENRARQIVSSNNNVETIDCDFDTGRPLYETFEKWHYDTNGEIEYIFHYHEDGSFSYVELMQYPGVAKNINDWEIGKPGAKFNWNMVDAFYRHAEPLISNTDPSNWFFL